jgi:hydroxymethylglutaryl-CoA lyase
MIKLIECPRDAMQGWDHFIPTDKKINYLNALLDVGFDTLDFGSFVSPKAIPQLADTEQVLSALNTASTTKLLAIVANLRGAETACKHPSIRYIGFPFSISPTFQKRNTNATLEEALLTVKQIQALCSENNKEAVIYISMGLGNPYGDAYSPQLAADWASKIAALGVRIISLSDTIGCGTPENINYLFGTLLNAFHNIEFGAHLHTTPDTWEEKIDAAYLAGCRRFDGALKGFGGCPMATDQLTGNMPTEKIIQYFQAKNIELSIQATALQTSLQLAQELFI